MGEICFLFGHRDAPQHIRTALREEVERKYEEGIRTFVVGNYGAFDRMAQESLRKLKEHHPDAEVLMLTPWNPAQRRVETPTGFDGTLYPPLEGTPLRYAIVEANRYMVNRARTAVCYVWRSGNTRKLLEQAERRGMDVTNLAQAETHEI